MIHDTEIGGSKRFFMTTPWTEIVNVKSLPPEERGKQLGFLIERYWKPVYFFIRRSGRNNEESKDLTQLFFSKLLEGNLVKHADSAKGRFRNYLLKSVSRFLSAERVQQDSSKSSFPKVTRFIDELSTAEFPALESSHQITPEREFDRQWVISLLNTVASRLEELCRKRDSIKTFEVFKRRFAQSTGDDYGANRKIAQEMNMTVEQVKNHYKKALRWYRHLLREEVASYVESQSEIEKEIRDLWCILG